MPPNGVPGVSGRLHASANPPNPDPADGLCRCDALPVAHPPGVEVLGVWCELALTGPRISPHLFPMSAVPPGG